MFISCDNFNTKFNRNYPAALGGFISEIGSPVTESTAVSAIPSPSVSMYVTVGFCVGSVALRISLGSESSGIF